MQAQQIEQELIQKEIIESLPYKTDAKRNIKYYSDIPANAVPLLKHPEHFISSKDRHVGNALGIGATWQYAYPVNPLILQCPRCDALNDIDKTWQVIESYHYQCTPSDIVCNVCEYTSNLMDWRTDPPFAVGHLAIHFEDWSSLSDDAIAYFKKLMGGDTRYLAGKF